MRALRNAAIAAVMVLGMLATAVPASAASAKAADKKISVAGVLTLDDFPSGWKATAVPKSSTFDEVAPDIASCKSVIAAKKLAKSRGGYSQSKGFEKSDENFQNTVVVLADDQMATKLYEGYSSDRAQTCIETYVGNMTKANIAASSSSAAKDAKVTTSVAEVSGSDVGTASTRYQTTIEISGPNIPFKEKLYFDVVYVQNGRSVTIYQHANDYEQSDSMLDQLIETTQRRLTAALAGQPVPAANEPAALGTAQTTSKGAIITVHSVTPNVPGEYSGDGPYTIADVEICAPKGASNEVDASSYGFKLVFADNTSEEYTYGGPDPRLSSSTLTDGACTRGNVAFEPTQTAPPTKVVYDTGYSEGKPLSWKAA